MRAVVFDLDGTLCDCTHRLHHVTGRHKDWHAFFAGIPDDGCYEDVLRLLNTLAEAGNAIVLCSGRPEDHRGPTETWLEEHVVPYMQLYMRPEGDHRPDHEVKLQLYRGMQDDGFQVWLVVDDRPTVVQAWRSVGLTCLQVRDWDNRHDPDKIEPGLLTLMVGPSGAGKTSWLKGEWGERNGYNAKGMDIHWSHVVSSDQVRADLCGDWRDQSRNDEVFAALHAVVRARVKHGLPVVVDATNLRDAGRRKLTDLTTGRIRYVVIDRPLEEKRRDAGWRAEIVVKGQPLIERHAEMFQANIKNILRGDGLPQVEVIDLRRT